MRIRHGLDARGILRLGLLMVALSGCAAFNPPPGQMADFYFTNYIGREPATEQEQADGRACYGSGRPITVYGPYMSSTAQLLELETYRGVSPGAGLPAGGLRAVAVRRVDPAMSGQVTTVGMWHGRAWARTLTPRSSGLGRAPWRWSPRA